MKGDLTLLEKLDTSFLRGVHLIRVNPSIHTISPKSSNVKLGIVWCVCVCSILAIFTNTKSWHFFYFR